MGKKGQASNDLKGNTKGFFTIKQKCLSTPLFAQFLRIKPYLSFLQDFMRFRRKSGKTMKRFSMYWKDRYPCLNDKTTSSFDRHYVYHTAWAARILAQTFPKEHVDISSYIYFATLISAFVPMQFYDYRPAKLNLSNLSTGVANLVSLPFETESIHSLSCMHVVEHIGLGRYGDPIDPDGDLKAIAELKRVLAQGGYLLFVVPIGQPKVMFNAHRIYSYEQIKEYFSELETVEFSLISDNLQENGIMRNATEVVADSQQYGCGCFWFRKRLSTNLS